MKTRKSTIERWMEFRPTRNRSGLTVWEIYCPDSWRVDQMRNEWIAPNGQRIAYETIMLLPQKLHAFERVDFVPGDAAEALRLEGVLPEDLYWDTGNEA